MVDIEWVENGIDTIEKIDRNTKMENVTTKLSPTELFEVLELELETFDVFHDHVCENLESVSADVLYSILVLSQRNLSNHTGNQPRKQKLRLHFVENSTGNERQM